MKIKRKTFIRFVLLFWLFLMAAIWAGLKYISYEVEDSIAVKQKIIVEPTKTDEKEESMEMEAEWEEYEELPDYSYLHEQVPDAIAYLMIPNTEIAYPVMYAEDDFYLTHGTDGKENRNGAIHLSSSNQPDWSDTLNLVFGHNMNTGLMFATLNQYLNQNYLEKHNLAYLITPYGTQNYQLIFAEQVGQEEQYYIYNQNAYGSKEYEAYMSEMSSRTGFDLDANSKILLLCTCSRQQKDKRTIVYGVLTT